MTTPDVMTVADYTFEVAHAEITGSLQVDLEDGTNLEEPDDYALRWFIEVRAATYPLHDEDGELITTIEPVFSHQAPTVDVRDWRDWDEQVLTYDESTSDPAQEVPTFSIGGGDRLAVSMLQIGSRVGRDFPFEWSGICRPAIDDRSGLDPFRINGRFTASTFTVIFNDEGGDGESAAARLLQAHCPMSGLRLADIRRPYADADVPDHLKRLVHAAFVIDPSL